MIEIKYSCSKCEKYFDIECFDIECDSCKETIESKYDDFFEEQLIFIIKDIYKKYFDRSIDFLEEKSDDENDPFHSFNSKEELDAYIKGIKFGYRNAFFCIANESGLILDDELEELIEGYGKDKK